jgi:hypothetical protein
MLFQFQQAFLHDRQMLSGFFKESLLKLREIVAHCLSSRQLADNW